MPASVSSSFALAPDHAAQRQALRQQLRARRRALTPAQQRRAARQLVQKLAALPVLRAARRVALYWPADGEIDARALCRRFPRKQFYLPRLRAFPARQLGFVPWRGCRVQKTRLHKNCFGIPEPRQGRPLCVTRLDVIVLPLTGFDRHGNRLGMGGGFYDRSLAGLWPGQKKTGLIGVAHQLQQVPRLSAAYWDIPLHAVVTECGVQGRRAGRFTARY